MYLGPQDGIDEIGKLRAAVAQLEADHASHVAGLAADVARTRLLEEALESVPVGVVLADANGRIVHGNSRLERMVRHPIRHSDDVDSYREWVSFHPDGRRVESHEYPLSRVLRDGETHASIDVHYQRGDGTMLWMRIIGRPLLGKDGSVIGASVACIDITQEREHAQVQQILIGELNHRVKNAFAVVKSIVNQSLRNVEIDQELRNTIDRRLDAYAKAHSRLIGGTWERADVGEIAAEILKGVGDGRIKMEGPRVAIPLRHGLALSMAFYELATNAWKHGSLSVPGGSATLTWSVTGGEAPPALRLSWEEHGGPPAKTPTTKGFGSIVLRRALIAETRGDVEIEYTDAGLRWQASLPLERDAVHA